MTNLTDTVRLASLTAVVTLSMATANADQPIKTEDHIQFSTVIPAGTVWNSAVRFGEVCAFDVAIEADDYFVTWDYGDRTKFDNEFNDTFRSSIRPPLIR